MSEQDQTGANNGSYSHTILVRPMVVDSSTNNDGQISGVGGCADRVEKRTIDGEVRGQASSWSNSGLSNSRKNDLGEEFLREIYSMRDLSEVASYYKTSIGETTFRNYRRGLADYARVLQILKIPVRSIEDNDCATRITARVFHYGVEAKWNGARLRNMKTAVSKLFSAVFGTDFTTNILIKDIIQSHVNNNPPKKERLSLNWKLEDLLIFLKSKPIPRSCSFKELTILTIVHLMVFKGLRFAEIHRLSPIETSPEPEGWKFWLVIKNHRIKESISIFPSPDEHLDTLNMLLELKSRIQNKIGDDFEKHNTFWFKEIGDNILPMAYDEVRQSAAEVLKLAGIDEPRPYHIKHAVLTFLSQRNVPPAEVTAFARHSYGSMAASAFYTSWDNGKALSNKIIEAGNTDMKSLYYTL
jgi:hypothetical protein